MSALGEPKFAWEPVTPRGVAAFARASLERLLVVQCLVALVAAASFTWLLSDGVFPTVTEAIQQLPVTGEIRDGKLKAGDAPPRILAEGRLLEFNLDLQHSGQIRSPAQFQVEFGETSVCVFSIFGTAEIPYPADQAFYFNRTELLPKWEAWAPDLLALAMIGTFLGLLLSWGVLATAYFLPVWLICFFGNRDLNFRQSWRLSGAALMPGALLMSLSFFLYDCGGFDLIQLCFAFGMHLIIGWIYLFVSPLFLGRILAKDKSNPFSGSV